MTSIFTKLVKSHALNLKVLLGLSDTSIVETGCRQHVLPNIFSSMHFILYMHLFKVFFKICLNPCEKTVKNVSLRLLHRKNTNTA